MQCSTDGNGDGNTQGPEDILRYNRKNLASSTMRFGSRQSTQDQAMSFFAGYLGATSGSSCNADSDCGSGTTCIFSAVGNHCSAALKGSLSFALTRDASGVGDITTSNGNYKAFFGTPNVHTIGDDSSFSTYSEGGILFTDYLKGWMNISGYTSSFTTMEWSGYPN
jgi:hypothetical protein